MVALRSDLQQANTEPRAHRNVPRAEILGRNALCSLPRSGSFPPRKTLPPGAQAAAKEKPFLLEVYLCIHVSVSVQKCQPCKKYNIHQKMKYSPKNEVVSKNPSQPSLPICTAQLCFVLKAIGTPLSKGMGASMATSSCTHAGGLLTYKETEGNCSHRIAERHHW